MNKLIYIKKNTSYLHESRRTSKYIQQSIGKEVNCKYT